MVHHLSVWALYHPMHKCPHTLLCNRLECQHHLLHQITLRSDCGQLLVISHISLDTTTVSSISNRAYGAASGPRGSQYNGPQFKPLYRCPVRPSMKKLQMKDTMIEKYGNAASEEAIPRELLLGQSEREIEHDCTGCNIKGQSRERTAVTTSAVEQPISSLPGIQQLPSPDHPPLSSAPFEDYIQNHVRLFDFAHRPPRSLVFDPLSKSSSPSTHLTPSTLASVIVSSQCGVCPLTPFLPPILPPFCYAKFSHCTDHYQRTAS